jgi:anti-sigma B factor antagonist
MSDPTPDHGEARRVPPPGGVAVWVRATEHALIVTVAGEIDVRTAPEVTAATQRALAERPATIVVDLSEVTFLGSAGLSVLLAAHRRAAPHSRVHIVATKRTVLRPIQLTGLEQELALFSSLEDALEGDPGDAS